MRRRILLGLLAIVTYGALGTVDPIASAQERLVGTYAEVRTSLAFKIRDSVAQGMLPPGWVANPFTTGPSKGANLVVTKNYNN